MPFGIFGLFGVDITINGHLQNLGCVICGNCFRSFGNFTPPHFGILSLLSKHFFLCANRVGLIDIISF